VTRACPAEFVLAVSELNVPHADPDVDKPTTSPETGSPTELLTTTVTVELDWTSAGILAGEAVTVTT
jgi:hypothetical protein